MPRSLWNEILTRAVHAPSGDNAQPWTFKTEGDDLLIFNVPERDATLYNFRQRGSFIGHGALIENISLIAAERGFDATVVTFPGPENCVARVSLHPAAPVHEPLVSSIQARVTNRKPYEARSLDAEHKNRLLGNTEFAPLRLIEGDAVVALAPVLSLNERLLFENKELHNFLFGMIRWSREDEKGRPGLYVKTMEFPLPLQFLLRHAFRHWSVVQQLNRIGLSRAIPQQSAQLYAASAAFGAIIISADENDAYVRAGRAFQRVWLTATDCGLSLQPVTALPYLAARVAAREAQMFSDEHRTAIVNAHEAISHAFSLEPHEKIAMLFRVGYDGSPTAQSAKMPPQFL